MEYTGDVEDDEDMNQGLHMGPTYRATAICTSLVTVDFELTQITGRML